MINNRWKISASDQIKMLYQELDRSIGESFGVFFDERDRIVQKDERGWVRNDQTDEKQEANRALEECQSQWICNMTFTSCFSQTKIQTMFLVRYTFPETRLLRTVFVDNVCYGDSSRP